MYIILTTTYNKIYIARDKTIATIIMVRQLVYNINYLKERYHKTLEVLKVLRDPKERVGHMGRLTLTSEIKSTSHVYCTLSFNCIHTYPRPMLLLVSQNKL